MRTVEEILKSKLQGKGIRKGWTPESKQAVLEAMKDYAREQSDNVRFLTRDKLASECLNGLFSSHAHPQASSPIHCDKQEVIKWAYEMADEMMKTRIENKQRYS